MQTNHKPDGEETWLRELFEDDREHIIARANPPEPVLVYWQAIQAERQARRRRAMRPILLIERIAWLAIAAAIAVAGALVAPSITWNGFPELEFAPVAPVTAALMLGLLLLLLVGWLVWNEE